MIKLRALFSMLARWFRIVWAAPVTLPCLIFYALPFWALGWYKLFGIADSSLVFVCANMPKWLAEHWRGWGGHCMGNLIVVKVSPDVAPWAERILEHELIHSQQVMKWGILQPVAYALSSLLCWMAGEDPYRMNIFEVAARRGAGQKVD